jgi:hypothetical protein
VSRPACVLRMRETDCSVQSGVVTDARQVDPIGPAERAPTTLEEASQRRPRLASALRERVYATLVGLSTVVLLLNYASATSVGDAAAEIAASMGALCLASMFAEISAHRVAFGEFPRGRELRQVGWVSGQTLETAVLPLLCVAAAALGWWSLRVALLVATATLLLTIAALALLATRRTTLGWPARLLVIAVEVVIALVVVAVKMLTH